mmetsp:Transcript_79954/g.232122  ORF Transcript_79954/g.232122 Transcript_79954/m.232122 type:complete len:207 (-) Transcript_79954:2-622(-)
MATPISSSDAGAIHSPGCGKNHSNCEASLGSHSSSSCDTFPIRTPCTTTSAHCTRASLPEPTECWSAWVANCFLCLVRLTVAMSNSGCSTRSAVMCPQPLRVAAMRGVSPEVPVCVSHEPLKDELFSSRNAAAMSQSLSAVRTNKSAPMTLALGCRTASAPSGGKSSANNARVWAPTGRRRPNMPAPLTPSSSARAEVAARNGSSS